MNAFRGLFVILKTEKNDMNVVVVVVVFGTNAFQQAHRSTPTPLGTKLLSDSAAVSDNFSDPLNVWVSSE